MNQRGGLFRVAQREVCDGRARLEAQLQHSWWRTCEMVTVTTEGGVLKLQLSPLHKLLAFKGSLEIPLDAVDRVEQAPDIARSGPDGTRNPGTSIPYVIHVGSFNSGVKRTFWAVQNPEKAISIWIKHGMFASTEGRYDQVVVEVADPADTIQEIERARNRRWKAS